MSTFVENVDDSLMEDGVPDTLVTLTSPRSSVLSSHAQVDDEEFASELRRYLKGNPEALADIVDENSYNSRSQLKSGKS